MFSKLTLKLKMMLAFGLVSLFLVVVGGVGAYTLKNVIYTFGHIPAIDIPKTVSLTGMQYHAMGIARAATFLTLPNVSPQEREQFEAKIQEHIQGYGMGNAFFLSMPLSPDEQGAYRKVSTQWQALQEHTQKLIDMTKNAQPGSEAAVRELLIKSFGTTMDQFTQELGALRDLQNAEVAKWSAEASTLASRGEQLSLTIIFIGFLSAMGVGFLFSARISRTLTSITGGLSGGADQVAQASREISHSSEDLSNSATQQASSLQETSSALEQVSAMVKKNADNAARSRHEAEASQNSANQGKEVVTDMIRAIDDIDTANTQIMEQVAQSNAEISQIVKVIAEIGNKTKVINDIVFQTKLLSFNASVEAARAGEHGKGFAVVAEEVGNLAQMSGTAAREITQLLDESIQKVEAIVRGSTQKVETLVASGRDKVETGSRVAQRCGEVLEEIVRNVSNVSSMVSEIAVASEEQASGIQEINKAMLLLDSSTQKNSAVSTETAKFAEKLSAQAGSLRDSVHRLDVLVEGVNSTRKKVAEPAPVAGKKWSFKMPSFSLPKRKKAPATPKVAKTATTHVGAPVPANVIPLRASKAQPAAVSQPAVTHAQATRDVPGRLAAGGEQIPAESDPRFEDI